MNIKQLTTGLMAIISALTVKAQLSAGSAGITVLPGTTFATEGLAMTPASTFNLVSTTLTRSNTPLTYASGSSINSVYTASAVITFDGILDLYYQDGALNGHAEDQLQLAWADGGDYTLEGSSLVDLVNKYVSAPFNGTFQSLTAASAGTVLPVIWNSFRAVAYSNHVALSWEISRDKDYSRYEIERSDDGIHWEQAGTVGSRQSLINERYSFNDYDMDFTIRVYRIALMGNDGNIAYSALQKVSRDVSAVNTPVITVMQQAVTITFQGNAPEGIELLDMNGKTIWQDPAPAGTYSISGLAAGSYILKYMSGNSNTAKRFVLY